MDKLQTDITSLYRLNESRGGAMEARDLGPLPSGAVALLITLGSVWILIGTYVSIEQYRKKSKISKK